MRMTSRENVWGARARALVAEMTLEEKIALMSGHNCLEDIQNAKREGIHWNQYPFRVSGSERLDIPQLAYSDGGKGIVCGRGEATAFPVPIMRGASFDTELEEKIGRAIGREARRLGVNFFGGVCVNLPYHPCWGRYQETYGEDSVLLGSMGAALVRGVQAEGVIACVKHYALNSMENSRFRVDITCSERTEREVFLPHFRDCVQAGAGAVMGSYNRFRGEKCCQSAHLLKEILRGEWGFEGITISDFFWGIDDTVAAANAGLDLEMCDTLFYGDKLLAAVREGRVAEETIDEACVHITQTALKFRDLSNKAQEREKNENRGKDQLAEHARLAQKSAEEGMTLIKNEGNVLPFSKKIRRLAVIGRLAMKNNRGDKGSSCIYPAYTVTPLQGLIRHLPRTSVVFYDGDDAVHLERLVRSVDAVVFCVGLDHHDEGEYSSDVHSGMGADVGGGDRRSLRLHDRDVQLLQRFGGINPNSAAVLFGGGTLLVSEWEACLPAILLAYYPGQEGGTALARVLFGDVSPGGKLPYVIPRREEDLPDIAIETNSQHYGYYQGYRYLDRTQVTPYRPFGFGLSYTSFALKNISFSVGRKGPEAHVTVKNTGKKAGAEVVQLYVAFPHSDVERPRKMLGGFQRVQLPSGHEKQITVCCPYERLQYYDAGTGEWRLEHMAYELMLGTSADEENMIHGQIEI